MSQYRIELYNGRQQPALHAVRVEHAATQAEANRAAARLLGRGSLRGASSWERHTGETVYQFGPRSEWNQNNYVVIIDTAEEARAARAWAYD